MEILIFHIWVCNKKDIVFFYKNFLEFATLKLHIKLKKKERKAMVFRKTICISAKLDTFHEINETVILCLYYRLSLFAFCIVFA